MQMLVQKLQIIIIYILYIHIKIYIHILYAYKYMNNEGPDPKPAHPIHIILIGGKPIGETKYTGKHALHNH